MSFHRLSLPMSMMTSGASAIRASMLRFAFFSVELSEFWQSSVLFIDILLRLYRRTAATGQLIGSPCRARSGLGTGVGAIFVISEGLPPLPAESVMPRSFRPRSLVPAAESVFIRSPEAAAVVSQPSPRQ